MDLRRILQNPKLYSFFQWLAGSYRAKKLIIKESKVTANETVLDIGCGPADILAELPDVNYYGFDLSEAYISQARKGYGKRGNFYCQRVSESSLPEEIVGHCDVIFALGLLHHLSDQEVMDFCYLVNKAIKPGGRLLTLDACYTDDQGRIRKYMVSRDRGEYVRQAEELVNLVQSGLGHTVRSSVHHNLYNIPYSNVLIHYRHHE